MHCDLPLTFFFYFDGFPFGKAISVIGRVSIVVNTGFVVQLSKDCLIRTPDPINPVEMTNIQKHLTSPFVLVRWDKP